MAAGFIVGGPLYVTRTVAPGSAFFMIEFFVEGNPAPQGSKRHVGRGIMVESCKRLPEWRKAVGVAAQSVIDYVIPRGAPVRVTIVFYLPPPKSFRGNGDMVKRPDLDKLARACLDALTGIAFEDDSQVTDLCVSKQYATSQPGASFLIGV